jgi:hypothetical protein
LVLLIPFAFIACGTGGSDGNGDADNSGGTTTAGRIADDMNMVALFMDRDDNISFIKWWHADDTSLYEKGRRIGVLNPFPQASFFHF